MIDQTPNAAQVATLDRIMIERFASFQIHSSFINDDGEYVLMLDDPTDDLAYFQVWIQPDGTCGDTRPGRAAANQRITGHIGQICGGCASCDGTGDYCRMDRLTPNEQEIIAVLREQAARDRTRA